MAVSPNISLPDLDDDFLHNLFDEAYDLPEQGEVSTF